MQNFNTMYLSARVQNFDVQGLGTILSTAKKKGKKKRKGNRGCRNEEIGRDTSKREGERTQKGREERKVERKVRGRKEEEK